MLCRLGVLRSKILALTQAGARLRPPPARATAQAREAALEMSEAAREVKAGEHTHQQGGHNPAHWLKEKARARGIRAVS